MRLRTFLRLSQKTSANERPPSFADLRYSSLEAMSRFIFSGSRTGSR